MEARPLTTAYFARNPMDLDPSGLGPVVGLALFFYSLHKYDLAEAPADMLVSVALSSSVPG
jgi:hypothetical protein